MLLRVQSLPAMAQQPVASVAATPMTLDGFELVQSSRGSTGYKWVTLKVSNDYVLQKPYHAQYNVGGQNKVNLGYHETAADAALAVAKYRSCNGRLEKQKHVGKAIHKKQVHKSVHEKLHRATPSSVVTCTAVEVEANEECDFCQLATDRLLQKAKPWHVQALLADFGVQTDGSPAELARRLADQLVSQ